MTIPVGCPPDAHTVWAFFCEQSTPVTYVTTRDFRIFLDGLTYRHGLRDIIYDINIRENTLRCRFAEPTVTSLNIHQGSLQEHITIVIVEAAITRPHLMFVGLTQTRASDTNLFTYNVMWDRMVTQRIVMIPRIASPTLVLAVNYQEMLVHALRSRIGSSARTRTADGEYIARHPELFSYPL